MILKECGKLVECEVLINEDKETCKMFHWSYAEVGSYQNFKTRHSDLKINDSHISFYDLNKVFINEPITIKGALAVSAWLMFDGVFLLHSL